jgi:ferric iron reductase protein FhuF
MRSGRQGHPSQSGEVSAHDLEPGLRPATSCHVVDVLAEVATISAYFEVGSGPLEPGWRPLTELITDPGPLSDRVAEVAERLGTTETRIAASIWFQGLAARLWSPVVGAAVTRELLLDLAPARSFWRPAPSGPLPLRVVHPAGWVIADPDRTAGQLYRNVVTELLEPLVHTVQEVAKIAPGLLWGNAASALAGTVQAIARGRPELAARASALGRELLSKGVLEGSGELVEPAPGRLFFVRHSCCLYYRLPGGGMCGDCTLVDSETRHEQWARAVRDTPGTS